jgi:hypothetical protein
MKSEQPTKSIGERFQDYAAATVQELDLLTRAGFTGITAVGSEDGTSAIIVFSGPDARTVFLRTLALMEESKEYAAFVEKLKQPQQ